MGKLQASSRNESSLSATSKQLSKQVVVESPVMAGTFVGEAGEGGLEGGHLTNASVNGGASFLRNITNSLAHSAPD